MAQHDPKGPDAARIAPASDEIARYQQRRSPRAGGGRPAQAPKQTGKTGGGVARVLLMVTLAALFLGVGWLGWRGVQSEANLSKLSARIQALEADKQQLEEQLDKADAAMEQTGGTLEEKFKFFDSEIRKLWNVAYNRNRTAIAEQGEQLSALESRLKQSEQTASQQAGRLRELGKELQAVGSAAERAQSQAREQLAGLAPRLAAVEEQLVTVQQLDPGLVADFQSRLQQVEQGVAAFDQQRLQLNRSLQELRMAVQQLQQGVSPP